MIPVCVHTVPQYIEELCFRGMRLEYKITIMLIPIAKLYHQKIYLLMKLALGMEGIQ